jgi:hypothetical protein
MLFAASVSYEYGLWRKYAEPLEGKLIWFVMRLDQPYVAGRDGSVKKRR